MSTNRGINILYYFHHQDDNPSNLVGLAVVSIGKICPAFTPIANTNIFGHYSGVVFWQDGHTYIHTISPFKFVSCFNLLDKITYKLSHPSNSFCMDAAVSALTSAHKFKHILECCLHICSQNFKIFQPNHYAAPALCKQAFLNGSLFTWLQVVGRCLLRTLPQSLNLSRIFGQPSTKVWMMPSWTLIFSRCCINHTSWWRAASLSTTNTLQALFHMHALLWYLSNFEILISLHHTAILLAIIWTPPVCSIASAYTFTGPICTPISPRCATPVRCVPYPIQSTGNPVSWLNYNFPIEALMMVFHIDGYQAGKESGFEGAMPSCHYVGRTGCCIYDWSALQCNTYLGIHQESDTSDGYFSDYYFSKSTRYHTLEYVQIEWHLVPSLLTHGISPTILFKSVNHLGLVTREKAWKLSIWKRYWCILNT